MNGDTPETMQMRTSGPWRHLRSTRRRPCPGLSLCSASPSLAPAGVRSPRITSSACWPVDVMNWRPTIVCHLTVQFGEVSRNRRQRGLCGMPRTSTCERNANPGKCLAVLQAHRHTSARQHGRLVRRGNAVGIRAKFDVVWRKRPHVRVADEISCPCVRRRDGHLHDAGARRRTNTAAEWRHYREPGG
jgi:hypothetical protein